MENDENVETGAPAPDQNTETDITVDPVPDGPAADPVTENQTGDQASAEAEDQTGDQASAEAGDQTGDQASAEVGDQTGDQTAAEAGDQTEGQEPAAEETENGEQGGETNITIVRPPAQITYQYQIDEDTTYHVDIQNDTTSPVPVLVTETLIEKEPGIMDKRLEDYTVTEGLLLLILLVLALRFVVDLGRRIF